MILVTTSLEATWGNGEEVLFLGEWCKLYTRREKIASMKSLTIDYHWDNRSKFRSDFDEINRIYEETLDVLGAKLNQLHGVLFDKRSWRIIIGPWLHYFTGMLYDRWEMIRIVNQQYPSLTTYTLSFEAADMIPLDMTSFHLLFMNDEWNHYIYSSLIRMATDIKEVRIAPPMHKRTPSTFRSPRALARYLIRGAIWLFAPLQRTLARNDKLFVLASYWPRTIEKEIYSYFHQPYRYWKTITIPDVAVNMTQREWELEGVGELTSFEKLLYTLIPLQIPATYLEGFSEMQNVVAGIPWPAKPKIIYTANAYSFDEVFKFWAAEKVSIGSKLLIGQHGGHYGIGELNATEEHEQKIADVFLTWGWSKEIKSVVPFGIPVNDNRLNYYRNGKAVAVLVEGPRYSYRLYSLPLANQWIRYFDDIAKFHSLLKEHIRNFFEYRTYPISRGWSVKSRLQATSLDIRFTENSISYWKTFEDSRLVVCTYNGTTFLELLSMNFPVVVFWDTNFWELRSDTIEYFNILENVHVFHRTPTSAASHINDVWDNVEEWWGSTAVQEALNMFRSQYCNIIYNYSDQFTEIASKC